MKYMNILFLVSLPFFLGAQEVAYDYFKISDESLIYERVFEAPEGYEQNLESQLRSISGAETFVRNDSVITFTVSRVIPQENEMEAIKEKDKNWRTLRIKCFSFNANVYLKNNRYKVVLTNIKDYVGAETRFGTMTDATSELYSPKNNRFRKWTYDSGLTMQGYFSYLFTMKKAYSTKSDW